MMRRNKGGAASGGIGGGGGMSASRARFQPFHIVRHPFFLATSVIAWVAWFTAFIGQCVSEGQLSELRGGGEGPRPPRGEALTRTVADVVGSGPVVGVLWFAILLQIVVNIHLL